MSEQSRQYGQMDLTLPHDVVPLPSQGMFYKNKKKSVKVGYLTAMDENILLGNTTDITSSLVRNKLYEPDMRVEDFLEGDIEAILIFLRNTGFGPEITVNAIDPKTKQSFSSVQTLDQLSIIQGQQPFEDGTFSVKLPKTGKSLKLKPITWGEIQELRQLAESYPKGLTPPRVTWRLSREIVELDGSNDKEQIAKFVEQMPIMDSKFIRNFMNENEPRLDLRKRIKAPSGEELTVDVGFGVDFFRPFF